MVGEIIALGSLTVSVLGSAWKIYNHFDARLDILQVDRETLRAEMRVLEYRIDRLEKAGREVNR